MFKFDMASRVKNMAELQRDDTIFIKGESPRSNISPRLNVNDLLKRKEKAEKSEKKANILIFLGVSSVIMVLLVILNL
jgi:hypothetical protein